jgi:hypothetical protein
VLIIEPAKDEWVRWAIKQNEHLPESERIHIFEPGLSSFEGTLLSHLMLNPFQPAAIAGAPIDMQTRCEKITALINATLPTGDILPVIMDEALYTYLKEKVEDFEEEEMEQLIDSMQPKKNAEDIIPREKVLTEDEKKPTKNI